MSIQEKGIQAFEFEFQLESNSFVAGRTEIQFYHGESCVQTNLPLPKNQEVYYWEAKMYEKPGTTLVSVGVATKPYPNWRLPGLFGSFFFFYLMQTKGIRRISKGISKLQARETGPYARVTDGSSHPISLLC
jgi:hypothetical protein